MSFGMNISAPPGMYSDVQASVPRFSTRNALIILNMQNDSFDRRHDTVLCEHQQFRHATARLIPYFRRIGDIIWVKTEVDVGATALAAAASSGPYIHRDSRPQSHSSRSSPSSNGSSPRRLNAETISNYFPSSRARVSMKKAEPHAVNDARRAEAEAWAIDEVAGTHETKPRRGLSSDSLFLPGSRGVELTEDMLAQVDLKRDLIFPKNYYSAFDNTPLLISLRMKLVTHIYLAGCLSNISVYATAADAVRHGFDVTVVEDCLGYRSHTKHVEAMQKMADLLGVSGIDSNEIIDKVCDTLPLPPQPRSEPRESPRAGHSDTFSSDPVDSWSDSASPKKPAAASLAATVQEDARSRSPLTPTSPPDAIPMEGLEIRKSQHKAEKTVLGPGDEIGEGDSAILLEALSPLLIENAFKLVHEEVDWQVMRHRNGEVPRRVAVQGEMGAQGAVPLYRHPADESPPFLEYTPTVRRICDELQVLLKQPFNHCLIQLYRNGQDNISEHSDKTLDIVRGSSIVNLSLGARRTMTLRSKKEAQATSQPDAAPASRNVQKVLMPHNSVFVLGWRTNAKWLHGVRADKRLLSEKSDEERAYAGQRISLTFRNIGTFTDRARTRIWGQGARSKFEATAGSVSTTNNAEMEAMIAAFGKENRSTTFDWDAEYGKGFDALNLIIAESQNIASLRLCSDEISNLRVKMGVMSLAIPCRFMKSLVWTVGQERSINGEPIIGPINKKRSIFAMSESENPVFRDCDANQTESISDMTILVYLNSFYSRPPEPKLAKGEEHRLHQNIFVRLPASNELLFLWQELRGLPFNGSTKITHRIRRFNVNDPDARTASPPPVSSPTLEAMSLHAAFQAEIELVEEIAANTMYIAGTIFSIADCAFWPTLNEIVRRWEGWSEKKYPNLATYWKRIGAMPMTRRAMMERGEDPVVIGRETASIV